MEERLADAFKQLLVWLIILTGMLAIPFIINLVITKSIDAVLITIPVVLLVLTLLCGIPNIRRHFKRRPSKTLYGYVVNKQLQINTIISVEDSQTYIEYILNVQLGNHVYHVPVTCEIFSAIPAHTDVECIPMRSWYGRIKEVAALPNK